MQTVALIYMLILKAAYGIVFSPAQIKFFILMFVTYYVSTVSYVSIAAFFYFLSENAAVGMVAYLAFELIIPFTLIMLDMIDSLSAFHIDRYYTPTMLSAASSDFILGDSFLATMNLLLVIIVYVLGPVALTILIFRRKELEF
jgi:ABC-type transport system involved in multi-copper enzyme maturation permease subunit